MRNILAGINESCVSVVVLDVLIRGMCCYHSWRMLLDTIKDIPLVFTGFWLLSSADRNLSALTTFSILPVTADILTTIKPTERELNPIQTNKNIPPPPSLTSRRNSCRLVVRTCCRKLFPNYFFIIGYLSFKYWEYFIPAEPSCPAMTWTFTKTHFLLNNGNTITTKTVSTEARRQTQLSHAGPKPRLTLSIPPTSHSFDWF